MQYILIQLLAGCLLLLLNSCDLSRKKKYNNTELAPENKTPAYNFDEPSKKYFLDENLEEISGLSWFGPDQVACVQDESGRVFIYNLEEKKIENHFKFGKSGDYEGIEVVDSTFYVLRSDGTIFYFPVSLVDGRRAISQDSVQQFGITVPGENDIEGLGYDPKRKHLLLAFKNRADENGDVTDEKPIYAVSVTDTLVGNHPQWVITEDQLEEYFNDYKEGIAGKKKSWLEFKPSGIAVHPLTGHIYIIASEGKKLIVLNRKGEIEAAVKISPRMLKQPEGICFAPNGDLYIASEGRGEDGFILKFDYQKKDTSQ